MIDIGTLQVEVENGAERLEKAADQLTTAIDNFERLENEYEMAMAKERVAAHQEATRTDTKIAADLRNDYALMALDPQLRADYAAAKAHKEALTTRYRALAAAVSARQSLLRAMTPNG